ncbi:Metal-dependent hydrolase, endonuclease/exonuclease/phosphatase family [Lentibacillus halodurans]|uniref:Metal-dependent hydrolase, endonuclease/exonuclease/phosphatase family n=1 Tax=Lentibacillus halodurans TaxID=237679 RepID=A0A1I0ZA40_9BACI|nr:endonuclease/exonuclease/phosphatase family protein [Lentibacillus halodurans]SFB22227.1 Metal-dependent hydrolase, endonuclease/exonuclease/phosphatase family [Lentibacillus halodurans]
MEFKVMTYNIHHGEGTDDRIDLNRIAEVIDQSGADIIGLTEVDKHYSKRSHYKNQIAWLAKELDMDYAFAPSLTLKSGDASTARQYGNALLSRYPITADKTYPFDFISGIVEGRSLLDATIQLDKKIVQINVTHLSLHPFLHHLQTSHMVNKLDKCLHPLIIMGDFNMKPESRRWNKMTEDLQDVWKMTGNGKGFTYPSDNPRSRLDYIFVAPSIDVVQAEVETHLPEASDHLPVKAHLRIS